MKTAIKQEAINKAKTRVQTLKARIAEFKKMEIEILDELYSVEAEIAKLEGLKTYDITDAAGDYVGTVQAKNRKEALVLAKEMTDNAVTDHFETPLKIWLVK